MSVALGVDVAEDRKGLDVVALDRDRRVVASRGKATIADIVAVVAELKPDVVCIDSPSGWSLSGGSRAAERELRPLGITAFSTPADPGDHPFYRWMRVGFSVYEAVAETHRLFSGTTVSGTAAEVFPEASAVLLAGRLRNKGEGKAAFRRAVLAHHGVDATSLPTVDRIDAALGALTGILALEGCFSVVGDPAEGVMLLPVASLPAGKLRREDSPSTTAERATEGGRALIITGPIGVGKSSVALALQDRLPDPWVFYEPDRRQPSLPVGREDILTVDTDRRIRMANLAAARAYIDRGFPTIVEQDLSDPWFAGQLSSVLAGIDVTVVVLTCSALTQSDRLDLRGDGAAARDFAARQSPEAWTGLRGVRLIATDGRGVSEIADEIAALLESQ